MYVYIRCNFSSRYVYFHYRMLALIVAINLFSQTSTCPSQMQSSLNKTYSPSFDDMAYALFDNFDSSVIA